VVKHDEFIEQRDANSSRVVTLPGTRGSIYTEDGVCLAQTTFSGASVVANPRAIPAAERVAVANRLTDILGGDPDTARALEMQLYKRRDKYFYSIKHEATKEQAEKIRAGVRQGSLPGISIRSVETREYPLGNFASQIVGFTGRDLYGQEGVERAYEAMLAAKPGQRVITVDALGRAIEGANDQVSPALDGAKVTLTINSGVQAIVEDELRTAIDKWDPVSMSIIVMDTQTGAILGIANYPNYDPNIRTTELAARKNTAITDGFEPGSMVKPLIYAKAFESGILTPDSLIEYTPELKIKGRRKKVTDKGHEIPPEQCIEQNGKYYVTARKALVTSSNTCAVRVGLMLGIDDVYEAMTGVGFKRKTGFDMGGSRFGESAGIMRARKHWTDANSLTSVSMGYEIQVTPMQMLNCFNAIANGGKVMKPWIINRVTNAQGKVIREGGPHVLLDTWMSNKTAREMVTPILVDIVNDPDGTANRAQLDGYQIAGKTGTAHKVKNGQYSRDKICSFVGFAPAESPTISVIVSVNEARAKNYNKWGWRIRHYGGTVAAPTHARVVLRTLKHLGVPERAVVSNVETPEEE
jgi:cell division protein FtsI (penicillin-binding protein 3)